MSTSDENIPALRPFAVKMGVAQKLLADKARSELYQLIGEKKLDAIKDGNRTLITVASIENYMTSLPPAKMREPPQLARKRGRKSIRKGAAA